MICRHCRVLQRAISVNPAHGRETEQITGSQPIKVRQGDGALFFSQPGTHLRSGSFVRSAPFRFLCSSLVHCELRCGCGGGGGQNDALCTPSVRPSAFVRSFSLLRLPSSLLTALASSFPPPPPSERASGAIERQEGGPVAAGRDRGRGLPNAFGPYYTK